jgi:putative oxygen-independent coproporphyrinogen III oxidase
MEVTLEANPGTVEIKYIEGYLQAGVNRLSLGVQSFHPQQLKKLGRIHSKDEAIQAFHTARRLGFSNINIDLMFGLPQQTLTDSQNDLRTAIDLDPEHISWYQLTIEPNTAFAQFPPKLPEDEKLLTLQQQGQNALNQNGYIQYEISAYAKNNHTCQHNLNYWHFGDYLGIGAGAHSKITETNGIKRYWNQKHPKKYLSCESVQAGSRALSSKGVLLEYLMNRLRLTKPLNEGEFTKHTASSYKDIKQTLQKLYQQQLINAPDQLKLTPKGHLFLNDILEHFL